MTRYHQCTERGGGNGPPGWPVDLKIWWEILTLGFGAHFYSHPSSKNVSVTPFALDGLPLLAASSRKNRIGASIVLTPSQMGDCCRLAPPGPRPRCPFQP